MCRVKVGPKYELSSKSPQGEKRVSGALFSPVQTELIKAFQYRGYILITLFSSIIGVFVR